MTKHKSTRPVSMEEFSWDTGVATLKSNIKNVMSQLRTNVNSEAMLSMTIITPIEAYGLSCVFDIYCLADNITNNFIFSKTMFNSSKYHYPDYTIVR